MSQVLSSAATVVAFVAAAVTLFHVIRDRLPGWFLVGTLGVLELSVLVVSAVGLVRVLTTERDVESAMLVGYLIAVLILVPAATLWSLVERSRFGTAIIILACLAVPVMLSRAQQIWDAAGHAG
jgi:hypothetical protein